VWKAMVVNADARGCVVSAEGSDAEREVRSVSEWCVHPRSNHGQVLLPVGSDLVLTVGVGQIAAPSVALLTLRSVVQTISESY
jgi:hypothetical protein